MLKGRMRKYKVSCEQELSLIQRPPMDAIREYRQYYCTEQSTGTSQSNDKTFWFFSGQVKCTTSLNRNRFFLSENDPLVLSLEVCNNSTATMRGMSAALAMEIFTDSSEERAEQEPSRLASSATIPVDFAIPVGDAMANACVHPAESKGFTWPLPLAGIEQLYPSFRGDLVNVQYRLIVKLLFKGVNIPLKIVLPVTMLEPPRQLTLQREKTEVPAIEEEDPKEGAPRPIAPMEHEQLEAPEGNHSGAAVSASVDEPSKLGSGRSRVDKKQEAQQGHEETDKEEAEEGEEEGEGKREEKKKEEVEHEEHEEHDEEHDEELAEERKDEDRGREEGEGNDEEEESMSE